MKKSKFYLIRASGMGNLYLTNRPLAMKVFKLLDDARPVSLESEFVKQVKKPDSSGYIPSDGFRYIRQIGEIIMSTEEIDVYTKEEIKQIDENRKEARKKFVPKSKRVMDALLKNGN